LQISYCANLSPKELSQMSGYEQIKRETEASRQGIKPKILNEIPMSRPAVAERFDDAPTPLPDISATRQSSPLQDTELARLQPVLPSIKASPTVPEHSELRTQCANIPATSAIAVQNHNGIEHASY
jgi:hypothetical protein